MPSLRWGTGHGRIDVCALVWKSENAWVQGGLSEHEMDRRGGLKWLTEPVYISNSTLLWKGGRGGKTALLAEQSGIHFSVSTVFQRMLYVPYFLAFLSSMILFLYEFVFLRQSCSWKFHEAPHLTSIVIYHVLHSLAGGPRGVCQDCCFDTQWKN